MDKLLFSATVGLIAGIIDITPMIIHKLPRHSTVSAFFHFFFVSIVILNIDMPYLPWWLKGGVVGLALTIPMLIQIGHSEKKSVPIITFNAILLGTLVGVAGHYLY